MTETATQKGTRQSHWGYCPVCHRERKFSFKTGLMAEHTRYYQTLKDKILRQVGVMVICRGTGQKPERLSQ